MMIIFTSEEKKIGVQAPPGVCSESLDFRVEWERVPPCGEQVDDQEQEKTPEAIEMLTDEKTVLEPIAVLKTVGKLLFFKMKQL